MAETSNYCKAFYAKQLRAFPGWQEDVSDLRKEMTEVDGKEVEVARGSIGDDDVLYVHDDHVVTDDIFRDQNVVFSNVDDAWRTFCHDQLGFEVPQDAAGEKASAEA